MGDPLIMSKHYIIGSGSRGCLYDSCSVAATYTEAIDYAIDTFDLVPHQADALYEDGITDLDQKPGGLYVEIVKCTCSDPSVHEDA